MADANFRSPVLIASNWTPRMFRRHRQRNPAALPVIDWISRNCLKQATNRRREVKGEGDRAYRDTSPPSRRDAEETVAQLKTTRCGVPGARVRDMPASTGSARRTRGVIEAIRPWPPRRPSLRGCQKVRRNYTQLSKKSWTWRSRIRIGGPPYDSQVQVIRLQRPWNVHIVRGHVGPIENACDTMRDPRSELRITPSQIGVGREASRG